ncbi:ABC transporter substrate-binding protein [Moorella sulfitireducens]|uniref:ABC transporter substrate-binding protein n=1 Tax=Neomoorella sulfitireducens TaxID=2972948 RepID=UPI0021AC0A64|nr:extracellular solute-binding protein [Moorella sulfitireducens]
MRKRKNLLVFLAAVLGLAMLAGCGGQKQTGQAPQGGSGDKEQDVELRLASWRVEEIEAFKKLNEEFNKEYPNIKIKYEPVKATEYDSLLSMALSTNTAADLMYIRPFDRGLNLFESGNLVELSEKDVPNLKNIPDSQMRVYRTPDGKIYALPYIHVSYGFLYNKKIFDKYGLKEPETWDEFFALLDTLKKNGVTPLALGTKDAWVVSEVISNPNYVNFLGGEDWHQALLKGEKKFTDPGFVGYLEQLARLKDYMPKDYKAIGYTEAQQLFLTEKAAIFPAGSWEIGFFKSQNPNLEMGLFTSPVVKKGDKRWLGFNGGAGIGVNKNSKHIKEAMIYVNWLGGEKAQVLTGNLMAGLFPCASINTGELTDPLAKEFIDAAGPKGENFAVGWSLEQISKQEPSANTLAMENITRLLNGELSPREAAANIQNGLAGWYAPFKQ